MTLGRPEFVRRRSLRVALASTIVVAVAYAAISLAVIALATRDLTAQVDARLTGALARIPVPPDGDDQPPPRPRGDRPIFAGAPILIWAVLPDGTVFQDDETPKLPAELISVTQPVTAHLGGVDLRLAGRDFAQGHFVVAQSLEPVNDTQRTIVIGELLIAPVLLLAVFFGAIAIGRRVAGPIEEARQRQVEFTADASHELRTPLSVIEANTSLALTQDREAAWYRAAFTRIDAESKRMRRLLEDMLWLARFDATQRSGDKEPVDLGILAAQTADRFAAIAETRRLTLLVSAPPAGASVNAPADLLDRLLGVLIDNACKYAPEGGFVNVTVARDGQRVTLTVDDSGPGVPADEQARIFDRFHRVNAEASGAGLGLAIGDAIVRSTGGRWSMGTSPLGGARFGVSWPRALA